MTRDAVPDWLTRALEALPRPDRSAFPDGDAPVEELVPGDIRAAREMDDEGEARLVLVTESHAYPTPWANVLLVSPLVEEATDRDVVFEPAMTGLPYRIIVETDVAGPLFRVQFGPRLGGIEADGLSGLIETMHGREVPWPMSRVGLPVHSRADERWRWKEEEIGALQQLSSDAFVHLVVRADDRALDRPLAEPGFLDDRPVDDSRLRELLSLARVAASLGVELPKDELFEGGRLRAWIEGLPVDLANALRPIWEEALRAMLPMRETESITWTTEPMHDVAWIGQPLTHRAVSGARAMTLLVRSGHAWEASRRPPVKASVRDIGSVQVTTMTLDEALVRLEAA